MFRYKSAFDCYNKYDQGYYPMIIGEDIEGDTIDNLEEWNLHPYKNEIMEDAMKFKEKKRHWSHPTNREEIGRIDDIDINIPIFLSGSMQFIDDFIYYYEKSI